MTDIHVFFRKSEDRSDVYKLLERAFESVFEMPAPVVAIDKNGKPYFPERTDVHFSLSHSGEYIMCALSKDKVGADIQKAQQISDKMTKRVFTENELDRADSLSLWCLKECFIKLKGKLDRPYKEIEFLESENAFCGPDDTWGMVINEIEGYAAAVCAEKMGNVIVSIL
ncbi:MAG: 4'-phosphopantetheinyl transferase superfamily protein [Oscillospiraceae bacterium]|nr:4'-phosphopantetheinyl transferase superfamily protein [Oscillospiraceae bacterium]